MTATEPKPTRGRGRPRKQPGDPKSPYAMTVKARKARSKAGRAGRGACKRRNWTPRVSAGEEEAK